MRWVPSAGGGGAGHAVRDWATLLAPWILTAVGCLPRPYVCARRLPPYRRRTAADARANCTKTSPAVAGTTANPVSYLCPEELQLPGNRRHEPVPRTVAVSGRD